MNTIDRTILYLEEYDFIPKTGIIEITEELLKIYIDTYSIFSKGNGKYNYNFARKLTGLTLLKTNLARGGTYNTIKEGLIYIITNPSWKDYFKVGMTIDLDGRLKSYQTYSPHKDYKVEKYNFTLTRKEHEKELLKIACNIDSEWIHTSKRKQIEEFMHSIGT